MLVLLCVTQETRLFKVECGASSGWSGQGASEADWVGESFSKLEGLHPKSASLGTHGTLLLAGRKAPVP